MLSSVSRTALGQTRQRFTRAFVTTAPRLNAAVVSQEMIDLEVDGVAVSVPQGSTVIQACEAAGVEIPRFCYHERLAIAGNCRMCLVEVERVPKPVASCAMPASAGMKVKTGTDLVKKAREGVMEFLLAQHPLDCPICDQAGECDLQDQSMVFGSDRSRYREVFAGKRAVEDKDFGPLVKTTMTRCIHCTRCVRFATEVAGAEELGTSGRGNDMEIGTYVSKVLDTELSGNIIDLCPVGALTSKPYAFTARPWELRKIASIDVHDALGSNIRVDARGNEVMRIVPRLHGEINEEWLADKGRFSYDGLKRQRLTTPMIREGDTFRAASWEEALDRVRQVMTLTPGRQMTAVAGQLADAESIVALKDLFSRLGSSNLLYDGFVGKDALGSDLRSNYLLNTTISGAEFADAVLLVGTNPRHEAPLLQSRLRKAFIHRNQQIGLVGAPVKLTVEYDHIGASPTDLYALANKTHPFAETLAKAERPMIIVGADVASRPDGADIMAAVASISKFAKVVTPEWNGFSVLQRHASRTAALDIGFTPGVNADLTDAGKKFLYLLGSDEIKPEDIPKGSFVVYQGHHGDVAAHYADVLLPGAAYTEKTATYVNTEGRAQHAYAAVSPPGNSREDWMIIRALSEVLGATLPYHDLAGVRARLADFSPAFSDIDTVPPGFGAELTMATLAAAKGKGADAGPFSLPIADYYMTDAISRSSQTMARCSSAFANGRPSPLANLSVAAPAAEKKVAAPQQQ
ncbi:NADH dehydrogenase (quinone), G subunit [Fonticula alba]|uniref:NADH dehydrogenase (Quinone), G subunit n=1 Tax=Fonticula alba TaxID=691883 RepID=A0A058Z0Y7_FONAL|nr:NADH dehydrogenase (quinone), G subunit [Fonticula alba]KCV67801.1 NADH dehydrogenase (quinone), G subunit [Fonticula alba]|eukprot:XP_009497832.1 NADH dehydrogenase (quinone), G subunit [Fonticula alba]